MKIYNEQIKYFQDKLKKNNRRLKNTPCKQKAEHEILSLERLQIKKALALAIEKEKERINWTNWNK